MPGHLPGHEEHAAFFERAVAGLFLATVADGRVYDCNDAFLRMLGLSDRAQLEAFTLFDHLVWETDERAALRARLEAAGEIDGAELHLRRADGVEGWVLLAARLIGPNQFQGTVVNITRRKQAERALAGREALLRTVLDSIPSGVVRIEADGRISLANSSAVRILGLRAEELDGLSTYTLLDGWSVVRPDGTSLPPEHYPPLIALRTGRTTPPAVIGVCRPDGTTVWLLLTNGVLANAVTGAPDAVIAAFTDVTEIRTLDERFRTLLEALPIGVLVACERDGDIHVHETNAAASRIVGMTADAMRNTPLSTVHGSAVVALRADGSALALEDFPPFVAARTGRPVADELLRIPQADGSEIAVIANAVPLGRRSDGCAEAIVTLTDVTRMRALERELVRAQQWEMLALFAGGPVHDLNNVLMGIGTYADLLRRITPDERAQEYVAKLKMLTGRGRELTGRTLTAFRGRAIHREVLDLGALLPEWLALIGAAAGRRLRLDREIGPELWPIMADPGSLQQLLSNLVLNANDAMPDGGRVIVRANNVIAGENENGFRPPLVAGAAYVALEVEDNGPGIPPEVLPRIFEPLFTTKTEGPTRGTGLGLMVVSSVVDQERAYLRVTTEVGRGTTFSVFLPRYVATE